MEIAPPPEGAAVSETATAEPEPEPDRATEPGARERIDIEELARYTIPIHAVLPWLLWAVSALGPEVSAWLFLAFHALFPVVLIATYRWWRGQGFSLVVLVAINHLVTFVSGGVAAAVAAAL